MDWDHKEELRLEELQEQREEPMYQWIEDNNPMLEEEFIKTMPPEEIPLDDDIPDFMDYHSDDFDAFSRNFYFEEHDQMITQKGEVKVILL